MNPIKQTFHVLLTRDGDERRLLRGMRRNNDFYSTVPGDLSHRSYHGDGRAHTKIEDWGDYNHYTDIEFKDVPGQTEGIVIVQGLITRAEGCHHQLESKFKRLEKTLKKDEIVFRINANEIIRDSLFCVAICVSADKKQIDKYAKSIEEAGHLNVLAIETAPEIDGAILFGIAFVEKSEGKFSIGCMHAFGRDSEPLIPLPGTHSVIQGRSQIYTIPITPEMRMGPPSPPLHKNPPNLPYKLGSWMKTYKCKIEVSRFKHIWVEVGQLSICALYKQGFRGQQLIVATPTAKICTGDLLVINNSHSLATLISKEYIILNFQFGPIGGHTVTQFNFEDLKFQMEIKGVRGLNGYEDNLGSVKITQPDEYDVEVIEIIDSIARSP